MECYIQEHHLNQPPRAHSRMHLRVNGKEWPTSVQDHFNKFCVSKCIDKLTIYSHHTILRSSLRHRHLRLLGGKNYYHQG